MPAGVAPKGFHGKKGRSGRKCYRDEQLRIEVIENAWLKKKKKMTDNDATQIVLKDMTTKTEHSGSLEVKTITGMKIQLDGDNIQDKDKTTG